MAATKPRPRTGQRRETNQPLKIDRLPPSVHEAIQVLRNREGKTWAEIEDISALPKNKGGFVDWMNLPTAVLELFPDMRLPHTNLHRWFDLRVRQVTQDVMLRSKQARQIAEAFAKSAVAEGDEAVVNAARDTIMTVLAEDSSAGGRKAAARALIALAEVMQTVRANTIKERKVAVDERKLAQMEKDADLKRKRMEVETEKLTRKVGKGELTLDDINKLRRNTFGLPPLAADGTAEAA